MRDLSGTCSPFSFFINPHTLCPMRVFDPQPEELSRFQLFAERICKIDLAVDFMFYDFTDERARERKTIYFAPTFPPVSGHKRSGRSGCTCIDALVVHKKEKNKNERKVEKDSVRVDVFPPSRLSSTPVLLRSLHPRASCTPFPIPRLPLVFLPGLVQILTLTFVFAILYSRTEMDNSMLFFSIARAYDKGGNQHQSIKNIFFCRSLLLALSLSLSLSLFLFIIHKLLSYAISILSVSFCHFFIDILSTFHL